MSSGIRQAMVLIAISLLLVVSAAAIAEPEVQRLLAACSTLLSGAILMLAWHEEDVQL